MRNKIDQVWLYARWLEFLIILRIELYPFQHEMAQGFLKLPEYADCTQSRQSGKSFVLGVLIYFLAYTLRWDIIIVAPKLDQTQRIMAVVSKIASWMKRKKHIPHPTHSTKHIQIADRGSIICISGDPFAEVEGHHAHLIVLDEKQGLQKDHVVNKILPFRGFHNGLVWSLGIGGEPASWGETSRMRSASSGNFIWEAPWQIIVRDKPEYLSIVEDQRLLMLPVEFAAHYECKELDMTSHLLIPHLQSYLELPNLRALITIGLDFGSIDKTVATVSHKIGDSYYWHEWKVWTGDYSIQRKELAKWLRDVVDYDTVIGEYNGVGRSVIDELNSDGLGIIPLNIDQSIKDTAAHRILNLASKGLLRYNAGHELASVFHGDITKLQYKMTSIHHVKVEHSDFYSSGILTLLETPKARIAA